MSLPADSHELVDILRSISPAPKSATRLATIDPAYASGRPRVTFDGETTLSTRLYPYLSSYAPAAGDRVLLLRSGRTWVVLGKVV